MTNHLTDEKQFRFQKYHSTDHAILLQSFGEISESFDRNKYTLGVFIDVSKAFDSQNFIK